MHDMYFNPRKICRDWTGDQISLEDILSNSVHCAPFWSLSICPYCAERVDVASITCWIDHFASVHRSLFTSSFTCPACVGIKVCTYGTYVQHWDEYHARSLAMLVVLDETNVSARLGCGLALASLMMSMERFKLNVETMQQVNPEQTSMITAFGGYVPATANAKELAMEIRKIQMSMLPGDWRTEREKQEEEAAQKKRASRSQDGARAAKQKARSSAADAWREPSRAPSVASSRAASPAPSASWAEVAGGSSERSEMMSPGVPGEDWEGVKELADLIGDRKCTDRTDVVDEMFDEDQM